MYETDIKKLNINLENCAFLWYGYFAMYGAKNRKFRYCF